MKPGVVRRRLTVFVTRRAGARCWYFTLKIVIDAGNESSRHISRSRSELGSKDQTIDGETDRNNGIAHDTHP
jgi:hypothetical protein